MLSCKQQEEKGVCMRGLRGGGGGNDWDFILLKSDGSGRFQVDESEGVVPRNYGKPVI